MSNPWFRMYSEFANDPKVQMMSEQYQRRLLMLFCIRCNGDVTLQDEEVSFQLRIGSVEWGETKAEFIKRQFIDSQNNILNWDKRQYRSDSSADRVRRHRVAKKQHDVTICNVTVTPPEQIQNRTDTEQKEEDFVFKERPTTIDLETNRIEKIPKAETPNGNYHATEFHPRYVEVREFIVNRLPKLKTTNASEVNRWLMSGADPEGDIFPNIEHCIEFRRGDIGSFNYFTNSITSSIQIKKERTEQESRMREKYAKSN